MPAAVTLGKPENAVKTPPLWSNAGSPKIGKGYQTCGGNGGIRDERAGNQDVCGSMTTGWSQQLPDDAESSIHGTGT
jgi:hypothetical protein